MGSKRERGRERLQPEQRRPARDGATQATREEAMSVPTIARARGIICSSIASIGLQLRDNTTGLEVPAPRVIRDPDPRVPGSATYVWTAEDLLFYGYAYWQITELFADTMRIRSVQRIVPTRVGVFLNNLRERCLSYPPKSLGFWEYSADDFCKITDKEAWYQANPALGYLVDEETIEESISTATAEASRTETLCQWVSALKSPWPYRAFEDLTVQDLKLEPGRLTIFGMDISVTKKQAHQSKAQYAEKESNDLPF